MSKFNKDFIKNYREGSDLKYFPETDFKYPEELHKRNNDLPFLPERMKIGKTCG